MSWFRTGRQGKAADGPSKKTHGTSRTTGGTDGQARRRWPFGRGDRAARPAKPRTGRLRKAVLLWGGLGTLLAAGLVFLFFFSAAFVVKDVQVVGVKGELADTVVDLAQIPHGRPLARVSESGVQERVLTDTRIGHVTVERGWPSTVTFNVSARQPSLVLRHGSKRWFSDDQGIVFAQVQGRTAAAAADKLPTARTVDPPDEITAEQAVGMLEILDTAPAEKVLEGELEVPVLDRDGRVRLTIGQVSVDWGEPVENEQKWAVVAALLGQESIDPAGAAAQTIDVSVPAQPVVTGIPPKVEG